MVQDHLKKSVLRKTVENGRRNGPKRLVGGHQDRPGSVFFQGTGQIELDNQIHKSTVHVTDSGLFQQRITGALWQDQSIDRMNDPVAGFQIAVDDHGVLGKGEGIVFRQEEWLAIQQRGIRHIRGQTRRHQGTPGNHVVLQEGPQVGLPFGFQIATM